MTERETGRLIAWSAELRRVHQRLREALAVTFDELDRVEAIGGQPGDVAEHRAARVGEVTRDLLLYCHGFCAALDGHHRGEDATLFPAIEAARPDLAPVLRYLQQDHSMITHLLAGLRAALDREASLTELRSHVDGVGAIMESHFRYEERPLLAVLEDLELDDAVVTDVLGPL